MAGTAEKGKRGFQPTHGHSRTRTNAIWKRMKSNCDNPKADGYPYLGGVGIRYDPAWASYEAFLADMGECPDGHTLKRKDHADGYHKGNCEWLPLHIARKTYR